MRQALTDEAIRTRAYEHLRAWLWDGREDVAVSDVEAWLEGAGSGYVDTLVEWFRTVAIPRAKETARHCRRQEGLVYGSASVDVWAQYTRPLDMVPPESLLVQAYEAWEQFRAA